MGELTLLHPHKQWGTKPPTAAEISSAGVSPMTVNVSSPALSFSSAPLTLYFSQVVNFMRQLSDNQATVESFLTVLGPGNWGGPSNRSPLANKDEEDPSLLTRYLSTLREGTLLLSFNDSPSSFRRRPQHPPHLSRVPLSHPPLTARLLRHLPPQQRLLHPSRGPLLPSRRPTRRGMRG